MVYMNIIIFYKEPERLLNFIPLVSPRKEMPKQVSQCTGSQEQYDFVVHDKLLLLATKGDSERRLHHEKLLRDSLVIMKNCDMVYER